MRPEVLEQFGQKLPDVIAMNEVMSEEPDLTDFLHQS